MKWTPLGPRAVLIEFAEPDPDATRARGRAIQRLLESRGGGDIEDFSIAFDKVLLEFRNGIDHARQSAGWMKKFAALDPLAPAEAALYEIPVRYDGPDLAELAARCGLGVAEFVELHAAPIYDVALLGFSPGFPYLEGLDPRLHAPRRANPRPRVEAGAVAIGGSHTGIYSVESPGGWQWIGRTDVRLFDPSRREPSDEAMFLLRAGDRVKFVPAD
ncbi:MAG: 5-oxoprolinase subunit PxpB [Terrimicrobiaceae bacterium]|nr:5-oxoprolinase subunit PxpB [Terrimicrobiaceae bacterium]